MTSATLFREGTDLDELLAELDQEHPGQVRVVEINQTREGGVLGFFARPRVAVQYTLDNQPPFPTPCPIGTAQAGAMSERADEFTDPLDALIAAAEMVETGQATVTSGTGGTSGRGGGDADSAGNVEFARMLLDIAARKAAERGVDLPAAKAVTVAKPKTKTVKAKADRLMSATASGSTTTLAKQVAIEAPATEAPGATALTALTALTAQAAPAAQQPVPAAQLTQPTPTSMSLTDLSTADERLTLRRRLSELGVPFDRIPADAPHRYAAVEQLVAGLPEVAPRAASGDHIVVVAGPAAQAARTAELLIARLGLLPWDVWAFRCPGIAALPDREIRDAGQAAAIAARSDRGRPQTKLVVVGLHELDSDEPDVPPAASIIRALGPDEFWLHVDATRKASDTAARVRELGRPTALVVTGASRTASPASVWELDVPIALLDGRPATRSAWAVLLLDKLADAAA